MRYCAEIAVLDVEETSVKKIKHTLEEGFGQYGLKTEISGFTSAAAFQERMLQKRFGFCFMEIELEGKNGVDLAVWIHEWAPEVQVVFVAARENLIFKSFAGRPFAFVRKAKFQEDMRQTIKDLSELLQEQERRQGEVCRMEDEDGRSYLFQSSSIYYLKAQQKYVQVVTSTGTCLIRNSMKALEEMLLPYGMIRCHRSYIVNLGKIFSVTGSRVIMQDRTELPLRRGMAGKLKKECCRPPK